MQATCHSPWRTTRGEQQSADIPWESFTRRTDADRSNGPGYCAAMRVGVLTGGGDCPGLNAVIRAVVRKGVATYGFEFVGFRDG